MSDRQIAPAAAPAGTTYDIPYPAQTPTNGTNTASNLFSFDATRNAWVIDPSAAPHLTLPTIVIINTPMDAVQDFEDQILGIRRYELNTVFQEYMKLLSLTQIEIWEGEEQVIGNQIVLLDGRMTNEGYQGQNDAINGYIDKADFGSVFRPGELSTVDLTGIDRVPIIDSYSKSIPSDWTADNIASFA